jgi:hypothetical protein
MLKAALVSTAVAQHLLRNHLGVLPCLFIPGKFIAIRLGDRFPSAHDNIDPFWMPIWGPDPTPIDTETIGASYAPRRSALLSRLPGSNPFAEARMSDAIASVK